LEIQYIAVPFKVLHGIQGCSAISFRTSSVSMAAQGVTDMVSIYHWVIVFVSLGLFGGPFVIIARRLGFPWPVAAICILPLVGLLILAFAKWPVPDATAGQWSSR
jgi:hypothetical protein